jgi:hypothetical protein
VHKPVRPAAAIFLWLLISVPAKIEPAVFGRIPFAPPAAIERRTGNGIEDAEAYRLRQAQKLLDLFEGANGRPAETMDELTQWCVSPAGKAAMAYDHTADGKIIPD